MMEGTNEYKYKGIGKCMVVNRPTCRAGEEVEDLHGQLRYPSEQVNGRERFTHDGRWKGNHFVILAYLVSMIISKPLLRQKARRMQERRFVNWDAMKWYHGLLMR